MIESVLGKSVAANLSTGGTVDGDLTITGNLGVAGDASINLTSVVSNSTIIDATGGVRINKCLCCGEGTK